MNVGRRAGVWWAMGACGLGVESHLGLHWREQPLAVPDRIVEVGERDVVEHERTDNGCANRTAADDVRPEAKNLLRTSREARIAFSVMNAVADSKRQAPSWWRRTCSM